MSKKDSKTETKYSGSEEALVTLPCKHCGVSVTKLIMRTALRGYTMLCSDCRIKRNERLIFDDNNDDSYIYDMAHTVFEECGHIYPVITYRPGDPEFEKIAELYRHDPPKKREPLPWYSPFRDKERV